MQNASCAAQRSARVFDEFQDVVAKDYIKRVGVEQLPDLGGVTVSKRDPLADSRYLCGAIGKLQHLLGSIEQGDLMPKSSVAQPEVASTAPKIQYSQTRRCLRHRLLQIRKGDVEAQPTFRRLEVSSVSRCIAQETFVRGIDDHFCRCYLEGAKRLELEPLSGMLYFLKAKL